VRRRVKKSRNRQKYLAVSFFIITFARRKDFNGSLGFAAWLTKKVYGLAHFFAVMRRA